jgi:hypothetical protein
MQKYVHINLIKAEIATPTTWVRNDGKCLLLQYFFVRH